MPRAKSPRRFFEVSSFGSFAVFGSSPGGVMPRVKTLASFGDSAFGRSASSGSSPGGQLKAASDSPVAALLHLGPLVQYPGPGCPR